MMYFMPYLTFAILLLFRASFAQSLPYSYQDSNEDEEALIDRLASLAAAVGSQQFSKDGYQNYDLPQLSPAGYDFGDLSEKEYLTKLPRKLAYPPDDFRFFLPAEQFPIEESEKADKFRQPKQEEREKIVRQENVYVQEPENQPLMSESNHFMKKNEIKETRPAQHAENIAAAPNNYMSSDHAVEKPFHSIHPVDSGNEDDSFSYSDIYYIGLVAGCSAAVVFALVGAGIFWYRIHQRVKLAAEVDYPAYGVTGPSKDVSPTSGDRKLAQSAQMYHYQHQKQQMAALQKGAQQGDRQGSAGSDVESDDNDDEENDYTVYECPGLAPQAGEMEVKNPLFQDETTPATPQIKPQEEDEEK